MSSTNDASSWRPSPNARPPASASAPAPRPRPRSRQRGRGRGPPPRTVDLNGPPAPSPHQGAAPPPAHRRYEPAGPTYRRPQPANPRWRRHSHAQPQPSRQARDTPPVRDTAPVRNTPHVRSPAPVASIPPPPTPTSLPRADAAADWSARVWQGVGFSNNKAYASQAAHAGVAHTSSITVGLGRATGLSRVPDATLTNNPALIAHRLADLRNRVDRLERFDMSVVTSKRLVTVDAVASGETAALFEAILADFRELTMAITASRLSGHTRLFVHVYEAAADASLLGGNLDFYLVCQTRLLRDLYDQSPGSDASDPTITPALAATPVNPGPTIIPSPTITPGPGHTTRPTYTTRTSATARLALKARLALQPHPASAPHSTTTHAPATTPPPPTTAGPPTTLAPASDVALPHTAPDLQEPNRQSEFISYSLLYFGVFVRDGLEIARKSRDLDKETAASPFVRYAFEAMTALRNNDGLRFITLYKRGSVRQRTIMHPALKGMQKLAMQMLVKAYLNLQRPHALSVLGMVNEEEFVSLLETVRPDLVPLNSSPGSDFIFRQPKGAK